MRPKDSATEYGDRPNLQTGTAPNVTRQLTEPRPDAGSGDFYICEFPKSGITYLTVLLANLLLIANDYRARATFASVRNYITDLCVAERVKSHQFADPPIRLYKTHSVFSAQFIHSLYLVRHPVDVMASNLRYAIGRGWWDSENSDNFLDHPVLGLEAWKSHVNGWLGEHDFASDVIFIHLLRYEDLIANPARELQNISDNFGWQLPTEAFAAAVAASTREEMRAQEQRYRSFNPNHRFEFVSQAGSDLDKNSTARILASCQDELRLLGYT